MNAPIQHAGVKIDDPDVRDTHSKLYDRNFVFALVSQVCFVIANTLMAHYARWIEFLGGDIDQVGLIMGIGATLGLILRPWIAQWINRLGSRWMWLIGYCVFSSAALSNLLIDQLYLSIYIVRSLLVLGAAIVFASSLTYISQTAPEHRRTEAIGVLGTGGFIGMLIGPWLGDFILNSGGHQRNGYLWLFIVATFANVLPAVLLFFMRTPAAHQSRRSVSLKDFVATTIRYWPGPILLVDFVFGICMAAPFIFVASFIDAANLTIDGISVIGLFFWAYAGTGMAVRLGFRKLPDRIGPRRVLVAGMLFMALGMFAYSVVQPSNPLFIIIPAMLTGTGHGLMFHTMTSLTVEPFPREVRGTGSALALMMLDLGTLVGAPILGFTGKLLGFSALFSTIGISVAIGLIVYVVFQRPMALASVTLREDS